MTEPVLVATGLTRQFGGLTAVAGVSLELAHGVVHAVIGPNGAGKSTLANMLAGELRPSAGSIRYAGREISQLSADRRSRMGIGRSYQTTNVVRDFSALENCRLAAQSREPHAFNWLRSARSYRGIVEAAERSLEAVGLAQRAAVPAGHLSHGEQRQLEIAMCLATRPRVLLLDEPLAGMGAEESVSMIELLRAIAAEHAVLLIEHDMDAVFALAGVLTVMASGAVLDSGEPARVRANPAVQEAYLGEYDA
ncbi:MAG: ABC transporter ATP-binding protein [Burkholderiales bacterium]|nr:ABC transporter ATP-binding protein [Burkholderiales bacterium]